MTTSNRIEQFKADVSAMKVKTANQTAERVFQIIGMVLMVGGVVGALLAYASSLNLNDQRDVMSCIVLAVALVAVSVLGAALFLRYSFAKVLRIWLLRQLYEAQANRDAIVGAVEHASGVRVDETRRDASDVPQPTD
jgi:hypothetical protein